MDWGSDGSSDGGSDGLHVVKHSSLGEKKLVQNPHPTVKTLRCLAFFSRERVHVVEHLTFGFHKC